MYRDEAMKRCIQENVEANGLREEEVDWSDEGNERISIEDLGPVA